MFMSLDRGVGLLGGKNCDFGLYFPGAVVLKTTCSENTRSPNISSVPRVSRILGSLAGDQDISTPKSR